MGRKIPAPTKNLSANGPVTGFQEACDGLLIKHSDQIISTAKKASDRVVEVVLKGTIDMSQREPKIELKIDVRHVESFKDSITGVVDSDQGKFSEVLEEASTAKGSAKKGESDGESED